MVSFIDKLEVMSRVGAQQNEKRVVWNTENGYTLLKTNGSNTNNLFNKVGDAKRCKRY